MAGRKLFINTSDKILNVTLYIRMSENPANNAGSQAFTLQPGQQSWVEYGNARDIYLNGIAIVSVFSGQILGEQEFVITRGSPLDNQLNMNNCVSFVFNSGSFVVQTSNV